MDNQNLANKIKNLRTRNGFTQEQLSFESQLSLRTIQRIENGETIPRGDTLLKLTKALGVTPDDILEWAETEDKGYLTLLNFSALIILIQPILGIIIPLVMWILKRDKIKHVDDYGKRLISFQITWNIVFFILLMVASGGMMLPFNFNFLNALPLMFSDFTIPGLLVLLIYLFNLTLIFYNSTRIKKGMKSWYKPAIPFLK